MPPNEFDIIANYFRRPGDRPDVVIGSGDDCAVLTPPINKKLLVTTDTLNEGSHFFASTPPTDLGYKVIAVSLSDIAAMGGEPLWALISLTLPEYDSQWLSHFADGLYTCLDEYNVSLVGGNLARGSLAITSELIGVADPLLYLTRRGAKPGDLIYVTGVLGASALAIALLKQQPGLPHYSAEEQDQLVQRLWHPVPRIVIGKSLLGVATAAIDISDGLLADLNHILEDSGVGATIEANSIPVSPLVERLPEPMLMSYSMAYGDDYELCFTVPPDRASLLETLSLELITCIGRIESEQGLRVVKDGSLVDFDLKGYKHF